jgi:hypothetical protein
VKRRREGLFVVGGYEVVEVRETSQGDGEVFSWGFGLQISTVMSNRKTSKRMRMGLNECGGCYQHQQRELVDSGK